MLWISTTMVLVMLFKTITNMGYYFFFLLIFFFLNQKLDFSKHFKCGFI